MHISDPEEKSWIQERIEGPDKGVAFTAKGKKAILHKLIEAEGFEQFSTSSTPAPSASASMAASR
jgi:2-oxoglutarate dehydrogenase E1 component